MAKLARLLGDFTVAPTLGDDSGVLHAVCLCVNTAYRRATTLRERCLIVHRFRSKLADRFERDGTYRVRSQHADEFALNLRAYDGKLDAEAIDFIGSALAVNIVLLHVPEQRMLRRGTAAVYDETIVLGWNGTNWGALVFEHGSMLATPNGEHPLLEHGV